ncbi:hypothetical protein [Enterococcus mediterraneensis]|uniref:hypothetical protein n=1 Tax=Enterococcus mediterraneensis TaxID=2364791 RepID=UPI000F06E067|nr:hypothetical protein [Enterococcus mediterraneensis]
MSEEAVKILKDFLENPDDYFSKKYPHVPLAFYGSIKLAIKAIEQPILNIDQQIVLNWLKEEYKRNTRTSPFGTVYGVVREHEHVIRSRLSKVEQAQVLQVFSAWALEQEEE